MIPIRETRTSGGGSTGTRSMSLTSVTTIVKSVAVGSTPPTASAQRMSPTGPAPPIPVRLMKAALTTRDGGLRRVLEPRLAPGGGTGNELDAALDQHVQVFGLFAGAEQHLVAIEALQG